MIFAGSLKYLEVYDTVRNLKNEKIGFIGGGMMGEAIFSALLDTCVKKENLYVAGIRESHLSELSEKYGIHTLNSAKGGIEELLRECTVVVLAVTPQVYGKLLAENRAFFDPDRHLVVSIVGGAELAALEALLPKAHIVRVMPNTPMRVKAGVAGISLGSLVTDEERDAVVELFGGISRVLLLPEDMIDPLTSVSGCGPAYAYMFIDAMADGGVAMGLSRPAAIELAAQTLLGAAKMVLETGQHPAQLKDGVCSPGGATIAGVSALEYNGFRGAVIKGVIAGITRMREVAEDAK